MIKRLRPKYSNEELKCIYAEPHNHKRWHDHLIRVSVTTEVAKWRSISDVESAADLSCGNGAIIDSLNGIKKYKGDFAEGYEFCGPIEETIELIPNVDLFILSETIEHLDEPQKVLEKIRNKTKYLLLSTPDGEDNDDNPEHYWGWDTEGIESMLKKAGFEPVVLNVLKLKEYLYDYQIWLCK